MRILKRAVYFLIGAGMLLIGVSYADSKNNLRIYCEDIEFKLHLMSNRVDLIPLRSGSRPAMGGVIKADEYLYILEFDFNEIPYALSHELHFKINKLSYDYEERYVRKRKGIQQPFVNVVQSKGRCRKV